MSIPQKYVDGLNKALPHGEGLCYGAPGGRTFYYRTIGRYYHYCSKMFRTPFPWSHVIFFFKHFRKIKLIRITVSFCNFF